MAGGAFIYFTCTHTSHEMPQGRILKLLPRTVDDDVFMCRSRKLNVLRLSCSLSDGAHYPPRRLPRTTTTSRCAEFDRARGNTIHNCQAETDVQNGCLINLSKWNDALTGHNPPPKPFLPPPKSTCVFVLKAFPARIEVNTISGVG